MTVVANSNAGSDQYGTYLDVDDDVKPWLQIDAASFQSEQALKLITDMACTWAQRYIGRPIAPKLYDRRFDGDTGLGGLYLMLPYAPVLEIVSVTEWWGSSGGHVLSESTPTNQVDGWQCEYRTGRMTRIFPGLIPKPWFPGSASIEIAWKAGLNPIPPDIKVATLELVAHWFRNTQQQGALRGTGLSPANEAEPADSASGAMWAGVPYRIENLIKPFLQVGIG